MNLGDKLRQGLPLAPLVRAHGLEAVLDELDEMTHHDMAYEAFELALALGPEGARHAASAARVVMNSGAYSEAVRKRALDYLGR